MRRILVFRARISQAHDQKLDLVRHADRQIPAPAYFFFLSSAAALFLFLLALLDHFRLGRGSRALHLRRPPPALLRPSARPRARSPDRRAQQLASIPPAGYRSRARSGRSSARVTSTVNCFRNLVRQALDFDFAGDQLRAIRPAASRPSGSPTVCTGTLTRNALGQVDALQIDVQQMCP